MNNIVICMSALDILVVNGSIWTAAYCFFGPHGLGVEATITAVVQMIPVRGR